MLKCAKSLLVFLALLIVLGTALLRCATGDALCFGTAVARTRYSPYIITSAAYRFMLQVIFFRESFFRTFCFRNKLKVCVSGCHLFPGKYL